MTDQETLSGGWKGLGSDSAAKEHLAATDGGC